MFNFIYTGYMTHPFLHGVGEVFAATPPPIQLLHQTSGEHQNWCMWVGVHLKFLEKLVLSHHCDVTVIFSKNGVIFDDVIGGSNFVHNCFLMLNYKMSESSSVIILTAGKFAVSRAEPLFFVDDLKCWRNLCFSD